jgi:hypothetical protein
MRRGQGAATPKATWDAQERGLHGEAVAYRRCRGVLDRRGLLIGRCKFGGVPTMQEMLMGGEERFLTSAMWQGGGVGRRGDQAGK